MLAFLERLKASPHRWCQDNLSAYIDRELSPRDHERVRQHLEQCPACQRELAALEHTIALLRRMPVVKAPRSFSIPSTAPLPSPPVWTRPWVYGALRMATAAVAMLFVVTVAGNALAAPALLGGRASRMVAMEGYGQAEVAAEDATVAASRSAGIAQGATPEDVEVLAAPAPAATMPGPPATLPPDEPTLTPEEEARRAAAPDGRGGEALPGETPQPAPPFSEATVPAETPELAAAAAPVAETTPAAEAPGVEAIHAAGEDVAKAAGEPTAVHGSYGLTGFEEARLRLARFPWPMWSALTAALLVVLAAALLWLRRARARWP